MKRMSFREIAVELEKLGLLEIIDVFEPGCIVVMPFKSWRTIARHGSQMGKGNWLYRAGGVCQNLSKKTGWMLDTKTFEAVRGAQNIARDLTGDCGGWSVASNARKIWTWALPSQEERPTAKEILRGAGIGFHTCKPGRYEMCRYWDMKSCYWRMLQRLESRKWTEIAPGALFPDDETPNEQARLRDAYAALETHKLLRNSVWGACLGSTAGGFAYKEGALEQTPAYYGSHPTAALLVGRMAWEATLLASIETGAYYAQTDSVICDYDKEPRVWADYGLPYDVKAWGEGDIRFQHSYRVGDTRTDHWRALDKFTNETPIARTPDRLYISEFLK